MIGVGDWIASGKVEENIAQVLNTGRISYGPFSKEFEERVSAYHGNDFGVLSNSGTSSLHVALQTLKELHGWNDGDEVLVPAATFVATYNIVLHNRLTPVLVDVDPVHFLMNYGRAEWTISRKTRCAIPVHLFGQPAELPELYNYFTEEPIQIIEDSCECIGLHSIARSAITCFSFYVAHIITTGVGGMAITNNTDYAAHMRSLVNHGRDNIYISIDDGKDRLKEVIGKRFNFQYIGHSFRITELESAIGCAQLDSLDDWLLRRRSNAEILRNYLISFQDSDRLQLPFENVEGEHAWMMFPIVCISEEEKKALTLWLEDRGVETRDALPLVNQPVYGLTNPARDYPNAYRLATCGFYVGCHQYLNGEHMAKIAQIVRDFYAKS